MPKKKKSKVNLNLNKYMGILLVVVALVLIAITGTKLLKASKDSRGEYADEAADREYRSVAKFAKDACIAMDMKLIKNTAKKMGFGNIKCDKLYCTASNAAYKDDFYKDSVSINFDDSDSFNSVSLMLYYSRKDFSYDTLYGDVNTIVGNYVGVKISKDNLKKIELPDKNEEVNENNYKDSKFSIESSLQYIEEKGLYVYRSLIIETDKYMQ